VAAGEELPEAAIRAIGRSRDERFTDARERMLGEAFVLFYDSGIRAVGIDLVIRRAGVAKATFYRHFPSKSALVVAYVERRHDAFLAWLRQEVGSRAPAGTMALLAVFDALADLFADPQFRGCAVINAVSEVGHDTPEVLDQARRCKAALRGYVSDLATAAALSDPSAVADQLSILVDGAFVTAQRGDGIDPAAQTRRVAAGLLASAGSNA
jgi:AcrR family transcriptional regulator